LFEVPRSAINNTLQAKPKDLNVEDCMPESLAATESISPIERVEDMAIEDINMALDGILAATQKVLDLGSDEPGRTESVEDELFGTQLMEPTDERRPRITLDTQKSPAPTFSGKRIKVKDDGGTGPEDEAQKIVII
jgi:hypothetical protein